ncbi:unnamed protein product [Leuciscus chuanchicus]
MKILLIFFTFSLISGAVRCVSVTGYSGGSLLVDSGKLWFSNSAKYTAKLPEWRTIINYRTHDKWINEGRFTLFKNNKGNLMIYIRELNQHDTGGYRISVLDNWRIYMTLNVDVEEDSHNVSKRVMVNIGGTATFSCEYSQNHINDPKIIFKEGEDSIDTIYNTWNKTERFNVSDDKHKNLFNVRITAVTPDDGGVYLCGVWIYSHSYSYSIINTVHLHIIDSCCGASKTVNVNSTETAFSCEYSWDQRYDGKTIFKIKNDIIDEVISTTNTWDKKERFSVYDDRQKNLFSVRITAVTPDDGGVYLCGVWINRNSYSYSIINTVHLYITTKVGVSRVTGHSGGRMMIKCEHPQYKTKPKYICKESDGCSERKNPGVQDEWMENGDVSLYDDTRAGVLMVFFRELKAADAGTYRCGVNVSHYTESFTELQLDVRDDAKYPKTKTESAHLGEEVNITCQIPEEHKVHFCKEDDDHICQNISTSAVTEMSPSSERNEERVFTVSISNVSVRDAGVYWCGAETRDTHLTFISLTTKIQLILFMGVSRVTGHSGGRMMIKCEHPQHKTKPKYICKESDGCSERKNPGVQDEWMENGDVSLYDDTRPGVLMVFFRELKAADAGTYRCGVNVSHYTESFTELQLDVRDDVTFVTESAHLGEEVNITCQIPVEHKVHFCKGDDDHICQNISTSAVTEMSPSSERNEERVFTVSISNVSVRDAGVYLCGAETRDTHLTFISLTTKIQLNLFMAPVVRREGESAEIFCPYDSIYKSKSKSLCKGKCSTRDRNTLNETVREEKETKTDRLTLNDDVTASVFTGTITGLTAEDAGKYWCALNLTKYEGDDMSIQCKHHDEHQKCFCKAHEPSMCVKDGVSLETIRDDRFSFSDEASTGVFTVNITDLREEDSGIYWCGSYITTKVNLTVKQGVVSSMSVTGYSGGGVTITCRYDEGYTENKKYFCKEQWSECTDQIKTDIKDEWFDAGRFSLYDDTSSSVFTVTIRDLREEDSGTYQCGVDITYDIDLYTEVNLEVLTGQQIRTVRGYTGGNVIINYKYEIQEENPVIDVCKTADQCFTVINTNRRAEWKHDRRFSVYNDRSAGLLLLFIRDLNETDSGEYKIIVKVSEDYSFFSEFNLDIKKEDCCVKSISLSASAGGSVNISCKYPQSHIHDVKFLCWTSGADLCAKETSVKESRRWRDEGKIRLYDDREQQLLTGSISHVTEEDSEYWCGVQSDQGHKIFITRVLISITVPQTSSTLSSTTTSSSSSSSSSTTSSPSSSSSPSPSPPLPSSSSSSSSSASSSSSVKSSPFTVKNVVFLNVVLQLIGSKISDSQIISPVFSGSSLIVPLVLVLLVLIIAGLLFLLLCKKRQSRGGDSSSQTGPGKHEVVSHTGCDYEEIKDTHKQLPTSPSDSYNTVYATAQLPTSPSDSSATVEKGTGDSQRCITSAKDLNYAVVNFHKESDCPDSVSFRNNQDYSEYAAVNHLSA